MRSSVRVVTLLAALGALSGCSDDADDGATAEPTTTSMTTEGEVVVIGHRGASGDRPEHTLAAYQLAIDQCADFIEPDLVSTQDHVLVARHESNITGTTDVAERPEFADRRTTKVIDGIEFTGWFTEDFTLAELKTLRAKERLPDVRPDNTAYDGQFEVPTLEEILDLASASQTCAGRPVGVYPETKHPSYFESIGLPLEEPLVETLHAHGYRGDQAAVFIQSFESSSLQKLRELTEIPLIQLVNCQAPPPDLDLIGSYADGIGACKDLIIPRDESGNLLDPTSMVADARARGLAVHAFTFREENQFLPFGFRSSDDPNARGDLAGEIDAFLAAGIDGFFTDNPDIGAAAAR